jgi:hypothetical protein
MSRLGRGLVTGLMGASLAAQAVPAPPSWPERVEAADVIVLGEVRQWKRTSWFWQSERTYVGRIQVERQLKGAGSKAPLEVHVSVRPGGPLTGEPRTGRFAFFLVKAPEGGLTLAAPQVHAIQALSGDELAALEAALPAGTH